MDSEFWNMNGYGLYIWSSYIFTFFVIIWLFIISIFQYKKLKKEENAQKTKT